MFAGPQGRLCTIGDTKSLKHVGEVCLDGALADSQLAGDLLVGQTASHQQQHFSLAVGERVGVTDVRRESSNTRAAFGSSGEPPS